MREKFGPALTRLDFLREFISDDALTYPKSMQELLEALKVELGRSKRVTLAGVYPMSMCRCSNDFNASELLRLRREQRAEDREIEAYTDLCFAYGEEPEIKNGHYQPRGPHARALNARERADAREAGKRALEFRKLVQQLSMVLLMTLVGYQSDCGDRGTEIAICSRECKSAGGRMTSYEGRNCHCEYPEK